MLAAYRPVPRRTQLLSAAGALLATASCLSTVLALAGHYDAVFLQVAHAQASARTANAQAPVAGPTGAARQS